MSFLDELLEGRASLRGTAITRGRRTFMPTWITSYAPRFEFSTRSGWPRRDYSSIANLYLTKRLVQSPKRLPWLAVSEDRRTWYPSRYRPARDLSGRQVTPTDVTIDPDIWERIHKPQRRIDWRPRVMQQVKLAPWWYGFANASKVVICVKRKIRREIMHALGIAGGSVRPPHFNEFSRVRC